MKKELSLGALREDVRKAFEPFARDVLAAYPSGVHSMHVTGSAVSPDYIPGVSDINSVFVLDEMDLRFLEVLAPKGKKYAKRGIAAPLVMTPRYIETSHDVFPLEFLDLKLQHATVYGDDPFQAVGIEREHLRAQCEREVKAGLIGLRAAYLAAMGEPKALAARLIGALTGEVALFRGIVYLRCGGSPIPKEDVLRALAECTGVDGAVFLRVLQLKREKARPGIDELRGIFGEYYRTIERIAETVDEMSV